MFLYKTLKYSYPYGTTTHNNRFPLGDIPVEEGVLAMMPGTANLPNYHKCRTGEEIPTSFYEKQYRTTFMKDKVTNDPLFSYS